MRCPNCGYENEMSSQFCGNCGAPLPPPEKKKSKAPLIIVIAVLVAVLLAGVIGFVAYNRISEKKEEELRQEQLEAEQEQEEQEEKERQEQEEKERQEQEEARKAQEEREAKENWTAYRISQPATLGDSYKLTVNNASATSVIDQEGHDNSPAMMLDGNLETSWQEGVDGPGIGEQVTFYLDRVYEVKYLAFNLGNWRSGDYYRENHRPQRLTITMNGRETQVDFPDEKTKQWVAIEEGCDTSLITITIEDVYYGSNPDWDDTCIAEVEIYGEDAD
ncbi:MAG TPA: zinc-ribbon domain-containing protein [Candidatus Dorea merdavium]|nr:zinc-ribbon domain-containing protein [Candidatus Dorea merdavium]